MFHVACCMSRVSGHVFAALSGQPGLLHVSCCSFACCLASVALLFSRVLCCTSSVARRLLNAAERLVHGVRRGCARHWSVAPCACRSCLCEPNLMTTPRAPATLHGRRASHICAGTGLSWAGPCHICAGTGRIPCHLRIGTGLTAAHICAGTRFTSATSAPGLGRARCSRRCCKSCRMLPRARPSGPRWCCASTTKTYTPAHPCASAHARPFARLRACRASCAAGSALLARMRHDACGVVRAGAGLVGCARCTWRKRRPLAARRRRHPARVLGSPAASPQVSTDASASLARLFAAADAGFDAHAYAGAPRRIPVTRCGCARTLRLARPIAMPRSVRVLAAGSCAARAARRAGSGNATGT